MVRCALYASHSLATPERKDGSMEFYETMMGRRFCESTMPRIATALETLADKLETKPPKVETKNTKPNFQVNLYHHRCKISVTGMSLSGNLEVMEIENLNHLPAVLRARTGYEMQDIILSFQPEG